MVPKIVWLMDYINYEYLDFSCSLTVNALGCQSFIVINASAELPVNDILEALGVMFFEFCQESGYDAILRVLGSTMKDFLQNLDALHDHLSTIYPGMRAPSFCCSNRPQDGATILHYYSDRIGLEYIVIGLVKAVTLKIYHSEVDVQIYKTKVDGIDHVQFLITTESSLKNIEDISHPPEENLDAETICQAIPFHLVFNKDMEVIQAGKTK